MKMDFISFSVIIPVYNIEPYLKKCIDTVLQGLDECDEIILSLGDSCDASTDIAMNYMRANKNIHVVRQTGKGLSNARNCAVQQAKGTYVIYVDGDDCVKVESFRNVLEQIRHSKKDYDVYMLDYYRFDFRSGKYENQFIIPEKITMTGVESLNRILKGRGCFWNVWRYIYKRDFIEKNNIVFLENHLAEDIDYTTKVLLAQPRIAFIHDPYYVYYVGRKSSLMGCPSIKNLQDTTMVLLHSIQMVSKSNMPFSEIVCTHYQFEYFLNLALLYEIPKDDRARGYLVLSNTKDILTIRQDPIIKLAMVIINVFGLRLTAFMLHIIKILRTKKKRVTAAIAGLKTDI